MKMNVNYIRHCTALEGMAALPSGSIPLTVTSPPYDKMRLFGGHPFNFRAIADELWRVTAPGGVVCWVISDEIDKGSETGTSSWHRLYFRHLGFRLHNTLVIDKHFVRRNPLVRYGRSLEYAFILSKGQPRSINLIKDIPNVTAGVMTRYVDRLSDGTKVRSSPKNVAAFRARGNVWRDSVGYQHCTKDKFAFEHPAIMSENLARDLIISWSSEGDIVLDPMAGSGTTTKMAALSRRHWIGFEPDENYYRLALRRMEMVRCA